MNRLVYINAFINLIFLTGVENEFGYIVSIKGSTCSISHLHGFENLNYLSHAFPNTRSSFARAFLGLDLTVFKLVQFKCSQNHVGISHLVLEILFVEHNDNRYLVKGWISRQFVEFYHWFVQLAVFTSGIYHKNYGVNVVEVMLPQFRCLATDIPDGHHIIPELNLFYIKTDGGDSIGKLPVFTMK